VAIKAAVWCGKPLETAVYFLAVRFFKAFNQPEVSWFVKPVRRNVIINHGSVNSLADNCGLSVNFADYCRWFENYAD